MGKKLTIGTLLGGAAGFLIGGPAGAVKGATLGASIGGAADQSSAIQEASATSAAAADRAAELQRQSAQESLALQRRMYEEGVARQQPYYQAGVNALAQLTGRTGAMPAAFQYRPEQLTTDPGYGFRLQEGLKALERSAAARGGLLGGGTGRALTRYGQEMASQEYGNAFNRALTEYNALRARESEEYNRLSGIAGTGGTTAQQINAAGQQYGTQAGNMLTGLATNLGNIGLNQAQIAGQAGIERAGAYGRAATQLSDVIGRYYSPQAANALIPAFSQTYLGGSGFGTGLAYGNQDIGQYL
jgi:hypothetical protein